MSTQDRRSYLSATVLNQTFLDNCHDNLENRLEMVVEIETPIGTIYASDRNKYVGSTFYEALLNFPIIRRTVGEWLSNELTFSTLNLELSNVDGRFNNFLPSGADYGGWMGKAVEVKLGLAEQASTYTTIFRGKITDVGGFKRSIKSITVIARDDYEKINVNFPTETFTEADYPKIGNDVFGKTIPLIYGDWTIDFEPSPAAVTTVVVNGNDPQLHGRELDVDITSIFTRLDHDLDNDDVVQLTTNGTLPTPFAVSTNYYVVNRTADTFELSATMGGAAIVITLAGSGSHRFMAMVRTNVQLVISSNENQSFDQNNVYLKRGDLYYAVPASEISAISADNNYFEVLQNTATLWVDGTAYLYEQSDLFLVRVVGKYLGAHSDNPVWQARDLLMEYGGLVSGDFDANWATFRDATSQVSRIWINEPQQVLQYALSLLEQVMLEAFVDRNLNVKINSLRFADWDDTPSFTVLNWDVEAGSLETSTDERNNFNRAQAAYAFLPEKNENAYLTSTWKNNAAITQVGKTISKRVVYPNLYKRDDVEHYLKETLKLASSGLEILSANLTWRSLLKDVSDFLFINVKIGSTQFDNVPAMIREIGYDPTGLKIPVKLWIMSLVPFPGYTPGYAGTVGGYNATLTEEV